MTWVLIMYIQFNNYAAVHSQEFYTEEACLAASKEFSSGFNGRKSFCTEKGS